MKRRIYLQRKKLEQKAGKKSIFESGLALLWAGLTKKTFNKDPPNLGDDSTVTTGWKESLGDSLKCYHRMEGGYE